MTRPRIDDEAFRHAAERFQALVTAFAAGGDDAQAAADSFAQSLGLDEEYDPRVLDLLRMLVGDLSREVEDLKQGSVGVLVGLLLAEHHGWMAPLRDV